MANSLHSREYKVLTALLIEARKKAGLTQQQVADRLGKPQSFVAKYEGGERRLDIIEFIHLCRLLNERPDLLVKRIAHILE